MLHICSPLNADFVCIEVLLGIVNDYSVERNRSSYSTLHSVGACSFCADTRWWDDVSASTADRAQRRPTHDSSPRCCYGSCGEGTECSGAGMQCRAAYILCEYVPGIFAGVTNAGNGGQCKSVSQCSERAQNQILINSSETADGVSTPDSVMIPEMRSGGWRTC